jgi:hypothetical protein
MTSSATSTSADVRVKEDVRIKPDTTFRASHFFVLASLLAATGAVILSRQSTPEHLILISLTIASAGLAAAGFYRMLSPLVSEITEAANEPLSQRARAVLEREKTLALRSLKDLEFDRSMGKLSPADFDEMSARLRGRALSLMKQLDDDGSGYRSIIERELSARLAAKPGERSEVKVTAPPAPEVVVTGLCTCGTTNDADAVFCKRCGSKLAGSADSDASQ